MSINGNEISSNSADQNDKFIVIRRSYFYIAIAPVMFVCGLAVGFLIWGDQDIKSVDEKVLTVTENSPIADTEEIEYFDESLDRFDVKSSNDPCIGSPDAPITVIEFSDFQCGYCARFVDSTLIPLLESYPDEIRFCYKDFPLESIHPEAFAASEAAECAFEQDQFWQFHNGIFWNQSKLGVDLYLDLADSLKMDLDQFQQCIESNKYRSRVVEDFTIGRDLGVTGTPTFFVNGIPLVGAQPIESFIGIIESELTQQ